MRKLMMVFVAAAAAVLNAQTPATGGTQKVMAPLIIAKNIVGGCSMHSPSAPKLVITGKNVTLDLDNLTYSFYFGASASASGLVFTFTPGTGSPIVSSIKADAANKATVGFAVPVGTYQLVINDRLASGAAGSSASKSYPVSVPRCPMPDRGKKIDPDPNIKMKQ